MQHTHLYILEGDYSQVTINDIVEDGKDFLWLSTQGGLNRIYGRDFIFFRIN